MVFGPMGLLRPGQIVDIDGLRVPLPRIADLVLEKLLTDRTGEKGSRDLLVVAGLMMVARSGDLDEMVVIARGLSVESQHSICSSLTVLSLMESLPGMPDPVPLRQAVQDLLGTWAATVADSGALERMRDRARAVRARAAIRSWEYRQRNLAAGVWYRLRRVLAAARAAYVISNDDARHLVAEGYREEPCGCEVSPEKSLIFVDEQRLATIASRREIRVGLGPEFLQATAVALLPFEGSRPPD